MAPKKVVGKAAAKKKVIVKCQAPPASEPTVSIPKEKTTRAGLMGVVIKNKAEKKEAKEVAKEVVEDVKEDEEEVKEEVQEEEGESSEEEGEGDDEEDATPKEMVMDETTKDNIKKKIALARLARKKTNPLRGVVYLGNLPYGFFDQQLKGFFGQFGKVTRVYLPRNKKTGNTRGHAFVEFEHPEVAKIVAETMNNYLMFNRLVKCQYKSHEELHADTFKNALKRFKRINWRERERATHNMTRTEEQQKKRVAALIKEDEKKRAKLAALGIDYDFPGYEADAKAPQEPLKIYKKPKTAVTATPAVAKESKRAIAIAAKKVAPKGKPAKTATKKDAEVAAKKAAVELKTAPKRAVKKAVEEKVTRKATGKAAGKAPATKKQKTSA